MLDYYSEVTGISYGTEIALVSCGLAATVLGVLLTHIVLGEKKKDKSHPKKTDHEESGPHSYTSIEMGQNEFTVV